MIRIDQIPRAKAFSVFAEEYYDSFFINKRGGKIKSDPISRLKAISKYKRNDAKLFFDYLKRNNCAKVKEIINGDVATLDGIIQDVTNLFPGRHPFYTINRNNQKVATPLGKLVSEIFSYKSFRDTFRAIESFKYLGIDFCAYCNITDLYRYNKKDEKILVSYDHFYSQVEYPFLSISLYNLIPSCPYCNQFIKGTASFNSTNYVHPYHEALDALVKFTINGYVLQSQTDGGFTISIAPNTANSKSNNILDKLDVLRRYNQRKDVVQDIWYRRQINPAGEMVDILATASIRLGKNIGYREFWETELACFYDSNKTLSRQYNKLIRDIAREFFIF